MNRRIALAWLSLISIALVTLIPSALDANPFSKKPTKAKDDDEIDEFTVKAKVPLIGDMTQIVGQNSIVLHGAGLVTGLNGTGEDPPPSMAREMVINDMKRRGVPNPAKFLKQPNVAIVLVTAYLPPLVRKGDHFDIEVTLPERSKVKSLNGGYLMETYLAEHLVIPGVGDKVGNQLATARGPILVSATHANPSDLAGVLRRGRIVAGGTSKIDRDLAVYLRNDFRSVRNATRIASAIGRRFFEYDKFGQQVALAEAKTDQQVTLKVLSKYRDNYPRYLDVIRRIAFRETDIARQVRLKALKWNLLNPESSAPAALELEAIGDTAIPTLKLGLKAKDPEVRYNSAIALAYLGDASGIDALTEAARDQYAFRVFALAAMSCLDDAEVHVRLRELMDVESAETRYGAFRALTTLDPNDPFVVGKKIKDQFKLHVLATNGPPMVHLTNAKKTEVVLFGARQELRTPLFARAGTAILVSAPAGSEQVKVCRYAVGRDDECKLVSTRLEDVILAISELGATFPDVAQFLAEANSQRNLPGRLEIDALPRAGRFYERKAVAEGEGDETAPKGKKRVGNPNVAPNIFSVENGRSTKQKSADEKDDAEDAQPGEETPSPRLGQNGKRKGRAKAGEDDFVTNSKTPKAASSDDGAVPPSVDGQPSNGPSRSGNATSVTQAGFDQPAADQPADAKSKTAKDAEPIDQAESAPSSPPSPRRFSIWRLFGFGRDGVSGNKEP